MKRHLPYILLFISLLSSRTAYAAADSIYHTIHFNTENGLPSNNVYSCMQDHNGYIWMATENGVIKYNGYSFKKFTTEEGLPNNDVWRLFEDTRGRIWVHTNAYVFGYIKNDRYVPVITSNTKIRPTDITEVNNLFLCVSRGFDFFAIDTNDAFFSLGMGGACRNRITPDTTITYIDTQNKICAYNLKTLNLTKYPSCDITKDNLNALFGSSTLICDNKIISTEISLSNRLLVWDFVQCSFKKIEFEDGEDVLMLDKTKANSKTDGYQVYTVNGVYTFDKQFNKVNVIKKGNISKDPTQISFVIDDMSDNKWVSTIQSGVHVCPPKSVFSERSYISKLLKGYRLKGNCKNGITYWWNHYSKTLLCLDSNLKIIFTKKSQEEVLCVADGDTKNANISFSSELAKISLDGNRVTDFLSGKSFVFMENGMVQTHRGWILNNSGLERNVWFYGTRQICQYQEDTIITSSSNGLHEICIGNKDVHLNRFSIDKFDKYAADTINNMYWFYDEGQILVFNPKKRRKLVLSYDLLAILGVKSISAIKTEGGSCMYILANKQLIIFDWKNMVFKRVALNFNTTNSFLEVYDKKLLIAGRFGMAYANIEQPLQRPRFKVIANPKSLYYHTLNDFVVSSTGNLIFNTNEGIYVSNVGATCLPGKNNSGMDFIQLNIGNGQASPSRFRDTIFVSEEQPNITLDMVNLYGEGDRVYTYKIGNGKIQTSATGEVLYNWKPDEYYRVECVAGDDTWKSKRYVFYVLQQPRWWQTTTWKRIFWIVGILILIGVGIVTALITRYYVRKNSEKKQALTDMELRALYAQINPHFIFNTLGTAQFFINGKKMDEAYAHINKFSRLLRAYLKASGNRYVTLNEDISLLRDYIELQQARFEQKFDYKIEVDNKIAADSMLIPSLLIQPLVENAINHGLFHMQEGEKGMLKLQFNQGSTSEELVCFIEDNGVGRTRAKAIKKDSFIEKDESYGTTLTKKLIDIFSQYEKMNIYLEYIDKPAPETGTIVKLTIGNIKYVA